jgi:hypothetical protein
MRLSVCSNPWLLSFQDSCRFILFTSLLYFNLPFSRFLYFLHFPFRSYVFISFFLSLLSFLLLCFLICLFRLYLFRFNSLFIPTFSSSFPTFPSPFSISFFIYSLVFFLSIPFFVYPHFPPLYSFSLIFSISLFSTFISFSLFPFWLPITALCVINLWTPPASQKVNKQLSVYPFHFNVFRCVPRAVHTSLLCVLTSSDLFWRRRVCHLILNTPNKT